MPKGSVVVQGVRTGFIFNKERLEGHRGEIEELINELPPEVEGEGLIINQMLFDKEHKKWETSAWLAEALLLLGLGVGLLELDTSNPIAMMIYGSPLIKRVR